MLRRVLASAVVGVLASTLLLDVDGVARAAGDSGAGGIWGNVNCRQHPYPGCRLGAGTDPNAGANPGPGDGSSVGAPGASSDDPGSEVSDPGPDPFYCLDTMVPYAPPSGPLPPPAGQSLSDGGWYVSVCGGVRLGMPGGGVYYPPVWLTTGPTPTRLTPADLARAAFGKLSLTTPTIALSPAGRQLVNLPTWLALAGWSPVSATAGVPATATGPGASVTATATPTSVSWSTGDGATVTCAGPGTVFQPGDDPAAASPTCGHTYRISSAAQPGGVFTVTATVRWLVSWSGAGQSGVFPGLTTTASARVPVAESQALTTP